jgi:methyl-accepting chemotaxis protein
MVSMHSNIEKAKRKNSFEELTGDSFTAEEISWLIENISVTVFRASSKLSWGMDYISENVEKLTGYSKMDFISQKISWSEIVFPEDVKIIDKAVQKAKKNRVSYKIEYRIKKSDGSTAFIQEKAHLTFDDRENLDYIAGVFLDATMEMKQREDSQYLVEDERIQLEIFRSFVEKISIGEEVEQISGDFSGETKKTVDLVNRSIGNIMGVLGEIQIISKAGKEGHLSIRADSSKYSGGWGMLLGELNSALDAIISPLNVAAEYVERMSQGDIPEPITEDYKGDFNEIKNNINNCIGGLQGLVECNNILQRMAVNDQTKGVEGEYVGIYASMGEATNLVRARVLNVTNVLENIAIGNTSRLTELKNIGKRSEQDCLMPAIIAAMENVHLLIEDTQMLAKAAVEGKLDTRADASKHHGEYRKIVEGVNETLDAVIGPLNVAAEYVERISRGDIPEVIKDNYNGDFNEIKNNLNTCVIAVNNLIEDSLMLSEAAVLGKLDTRADTTKHEGDFSKIIEGVNGTLDAVIGPLNVAAEYVERIGRGDIPEPIKENYNGDFNEIKNNLNNCIGGLQGLVECNSILQLMAINDHTKRVEGEYVGIFASMGKSTNDILDRLLLVTNLINEIAVGDISQLGELKKTKQRSEHDRLRPGFIRAMENIKLLIEDAELLSGAAVEGKLDTRADALRHQGEYRKIIEGVNDTLDAVIGPLNVAAEYVERISRGEIPEPITENYNGDFNEIKNNINNCIDGLQGLVECNNILQRMAVNDQTKGVDGQYVGIYFSMAEATNLVRARVLNVTNVLENIAIGNTSRLEELKKIGRRSEQDRLMPAITGAMANVHLLIEDIEMLARGAVEGRLDTRADASKHQGEYRKIVEGVNETLDAVISPLNVAAEYVERISRGDIPELIKDNYNGDFNEIKNNLNTCIIAVNNLIEDSLMLSEAGIAGRLDTRADATRHEGDFRKIVEGVNETLDAVISPLNVAAEYVERISRGDIPEVITDNYNGDFNEIKNNLNTCIIAVNNLVEDALMLSEAGIAGQLDTRADATRHEGDFRKIVEGVNDTLDAVIGPLNVAAEYVERISRGDIPELIKDNYNGDFNEIKNNLNTCIAAVNNLVDDAIMLSEAGIAGRLDTRADVSRHEGDFRKIVSGVNDTLDAVIGPLNEAIRVSNEFSKGNFKARVDEDLHVEGDFVNFRNMLNNIGISVSEIIKSAKSVTLKVADYSNEASKGADDVAKASEGVAMSSQKSSELTRELLYKIEGINKEIVDLSVSNEKIADSSKGILSAANEVVRIGKNAQTLGRETNLKMGSVEKIAKESVDGINNLTEQIKQIDSIVQLINDITGQINLLSLNAAIEAARAGEHGRGFAVVAGEVKNLATKARNATDTIETVVNSVQRDSKKTADAINTANNEIIDGVNSVNKTLDALNTIIKNATRVTEDIGDIAKAIENQANISIKVVEASEEGNAMTKEVQKEAESLAAIAQETSASVQEIGAAIHEVTGLSSKLKTEMEVYLV